jgi:Cu+-exporting ATPase
MTKIEPKKCRHCKEFIEKNPVFYDENEFCCAGCRNVFVILKENNLQDYYVIDENPGISMRETKDPDRFAYLDNNNITDKLADFRDGNILKLRLYVPAIHCASCLWLLEKLPAFHEGCLLANVNFMKRSLTLTLNTDKISVRKAVELLSGLGYEPLISMDDLEKKNRPKTDKKFLYKLGVSGFCWGNIMLLSFPEYLGINETDADFASVFGWANLLLSLPVFFYGSFDYHYSAFQALKNKGINIDVPLSLGIFALFFRSAFEIITQSGAGYMDSLASLIFFLLTGKWFQQKTFDFINFERDYKSYFPIAVTREKDGLLSTVPLSEVQAGDTILLRNGELVPADGVLADGAAKIDYSFVTGEAQIVEKKAGEKLFAGGRQCGGMIRLIIEKNISQSYLTQLWNEHQHSEKKGQNFSSLTNKISFRFTIVILICAALGAFFWLQTSVGAAVNVFTAVLIIACPCALALNVPYTLGNALRLMAQKGFFAKDTTVLERTAGITDIVFDKTGTITHTGKSKVLFSGELNAKEEIAVKTLAFQSQHPLSRSITQFFQNNNAPIASVQDFKEFAGEGIEGETGGLKLKIGSANFVETENEPEQNFHSQTFLSINDIFRGKFIFETTLRPDIEKNIAELKKHFRLYLLSGDNESERERMKNIFGENADLLFFQTPHDKSAFIEKLKADNKQVMMIGDGLNDAGALLKADVGVAVSDNVHQFSPACDMIVSGSELRKLPEMILFCRNSVKTVRFGFLLSLLYNVFGVSVALSGNLSPVWAAILMPLSSISVVLSGIVGTSIFGKKFNGNA